MSRTVLVTGGAGFIGHHLIQHLLEKTDYNVISLDRLDTSGNLSRLADILEGNPQWVSRLRIVWHDLKAEINDLIAKDIGPVDFVLHLAAGSHVDRSIDDPMSFVMDNVVGTCNILNYARLKLKDLRLFLYFSTDEVFGPAAEGVFFKEDDRYNCGNPYAACKAGGEQLAVAFENTYRMPIIITHAMNLFGIRQHPEKFIPMVIRKVLNNETVMIHANKDCSQAGRRHYLNTTDLCEGVLFLMEKGISGQKYNLVGEREVDNLQLAQMIAGILGRELSYKMIDFHSSRPGHDLRYALDGTKMAMLGWTPQKKVEERLKEVVEWTVTHTKWLDI
jgi:dTDP-glucose 4,6-dehydratase